MAAVLRQATEMQSGDRSAVEALSDQTKDSDFIDERIEYDDAAILAFQPNKRSVHVNVMKALSDQTQYTATNDDRIEYDDAAILAFQPHMRRRLDFDSEVGEYHGISNKGKGDSNEQRDEFVQAISRQNVTSPEEMAAEMLKDVHVKLKRVREDIRSCRDDLVTVKTDFESMNQRVDILDKSTRDFKKLTKYFIDDLDVVIHQNTIIKHLVQVDREMELFECYITEDRHVIFIDQDDVLVEECTTHTGSDNAGSENNSCCACQYKSKMEIYDEVD